MKFFEYFPKVDYCSNPALNIMVRGKVESLLRERIDNFYPFTVKEGQRADIISTIYYGSSEFTWLIYYSNNMYDPRQDWVLEYEEFNQYLKRKYGSIEETQVINDSTHILEFDILTGSGTYALGETVFQGLNLLTSSAKGVITDISKNRIRVKEVYGRFTPRNGLLKGVTTNAMYQLVFSKDVYHHFEYQGQHIDFIDFYDPLYGDSTKKIVSIYDYENQKNEAKRNIVLINDEFKNEIVQQLKVLFL
jgi:hypothetical protein